MDKTSQFLDTSSQLKEHTSECTHDREAHDNQSLGVPISPYYDDDSDGVSHSQDDRLDESDIALPTTEQPLVSTRTLQTENDAVPAPIVGPSIFQTQQEASGHNDFSFTKMARRPLDIGGKRGDARPLSPSADELRGFTPSSPENAAEAFGEANTPALQSSSTDAEVRCIRSDEMTLSTSDAPSSGMQMLMKSPNNEQPKGKNGLQHQVDEQIHQEEDTSDGTQHFEIFPERSDQVIFMGYGNAGLVSRADSHRTQSICAARSPGLTRGPPLREASFARVAPVSRPFQTIPDHRTTPGALCKPQPPSQPQFDTRTHAVAPAGPANDANELLEVVAYKFRQQEQNLKASFAADKTKIHSELARVQHDNEMLRAQNVAAEKQSNQAELAINRYRSQISKARGLQKFLDGLGCDFQGLKRSYDTERSNFAARLEASEEEVARLEFVLAGKNEYESMLTNSKNSLEKLLEGRAFELQAVIQHRDMLREQLEERLGQLIEERDNRSRLEQLLDELRRKERSSLKTAIDQCTRSVTDKLRDLGQKDDQVLLGMSEIHQTVLDWSERSAATPQDYGHLQTQLRDIESRILQTLNIQVTTSTALADSSAAVGSIIQQSMQPLRQQLDQLEATSSRVLSDERETSVLHENLRSSRERIAQLESQLDAIKSNEANLNNALVQSTARIEELESAPHERREKGLTDSEVENKIKEAVSEAQQRLSENANAFIAQEKARTSNDLKKTIAERCKAVEETRAHTEELNRLRTELAKIHSVSSSQAHEDPQKVQDLRSRCQSLELKYKAAQNAVEEKDALAAKHVRLEADHETAKRQLVQQQEGLQKQAHELDGCRSAMLQACANNDQASVDMEVLRSEKDDNIEKLRAELSKAEERFRFAEAGIAQIRSSTETTIAQEQERYRKQREALQQRLDVAQSELQSKSEEAEDMRKFMEESVKSQQASWQRTYIDLKTKASESKAAANDAMATVEVLRQQLESTEMNLKNLQTEQQKRLQNVTDHDARKETMSNAIRDLRRQHDEDQAEIARYRVQILQRQQEDVNQKPRDNHFNEVVGKLQQERDAAKAELAELKSREQGQHRSNASQLMVEKVSATAESQDSRKSTQIVPPKVSQQSIFGKQRRKADRNTNTIVSSKNLQNQTGAKMAHRRVLDSQEEVIMSSRPQSNSQSIQDLFGRQVRQQTTNSANSDEMLDSLSRRQSQETPSATQLQGSAKFSSQHVQQDQPSAADAYTPVLDFSGNPIQARNEGVPAKIASSVVDQNLTINAGIEIFEDPQDLLNRNVSSDRMHADFTLRKPMPLPNSASKRSKRNASEGSMDKGISSQTARRTPENGIENGLHQPRKGRRTPQNAMEESSPDFMNPPSSKVKRRYSGSHSSGAAERSLLRHVLPTSRQPSSPLPDPRVLARSNGAKRQSPDESQQTEDYPRKKTANQTFSKTTERRFSNDSFLARSSQSVSDLPRIQDANQGRLSDKSQASRLRTSGPSPRATRSQTKKNKDETYKARFLQEFN